MDPNEDTSPRVSVLRLPKDSRQWCSAIVVADERTRIEVEGIFPALGGQVVETVRIRGPGAWDAMEAIRRDARTADHEVLEDEPESCLVRFRAEACKACDFARWGGLTPTFPLRVRPETCEWTFTTARTDRRDAVVRYWSDAASLLPDILDEGERAGKLTLRQREVLRAAVWSGYYATPRKITLGQLAAKLSVAPSSLSAILQKIEAKVLADAANRDG